MAIKDKIKYIEDKTGLVFDASSWDTDSYDGTVARWLLSKKLVDENQYSKLLTLTDRNNFYKNYYYNEPLNSESILFINLIYNILK